MWYSNRSPTFQKLAASIPGKFRIMLKLDKTPILCYTKTSLCGVVIHCVVLVVND